MERAAVSQSTAAAVTFKDGLGERRHIADPTGNETLELLCLRRELSAVPSFEFALRERVSRLASFRHEQFARVRSVERLSDRESTLAVGSERTHGTRVSELLANADQRRLALDISSALCLIGQLVPAVAALHESARDVAHGTIGPERLVVRPDGRLLVIEYVLGAALEQLRYPRERDWSELRVALPSSAGLPRFDQRADVTQMCVVALSLILGRPMRDDEYPARIADVVASTWAVSPRGGFEPLPPGLRSWLGRALELDGRTGFATAIEARTELDKVLGDVADSAAAQKSLETFLSRYHSTGNTPAPPMPRPALTLQPPVSAPPARVEAPHTPPRGTQVAAHATPAAGTMRPAGATPAAGTVRPAGMTPPQGIPARPSALVAKPPASNTPPAGTPVVQTTPPHGTVARPSAAIAKPPALNTPPAGTPVVQTTPPRGTAASAAQTPSRGIPITPATLASALVPPPPRTPVAHAPTAAPPAPPPQLEFQSLADAVDVKPPTPARGTPRTTPRPSYDHPRPSPEQPARPSYEQTRPSYEQARPSYEQPRPTHDQARSSYEQTRPYYEQTQAVPLVLDNDDAPSSKWRKLAAIAAAVLLVVLGGLYAASRYLTPAPQAAQTGTLAIATNPPGAQALVNGQVRGVTPMTLALPPGSPRIELRGASGSKTLMVTIAAGTQVAQDIELRPPATGAGQLQVRTEPAGARVTVDGVARGISPTTVPDLAPGEHAVLLESDLGSIKQTGTIEAGSVAPLAVPLSAPEGGPGSGWVAV